MFITPASVLEWLLGLSDIKEIKQGYAVIVSSTIVVIGWYFTRLGQIKSDRVKNTSGFVGVLRDKELQDARKKIAPIVNGYKVFENKSDDVSMNMIKMLHHLEYQSASVRAGLISEKFIIITEQTFIKTVFMSCSKHINYMRIERKSRTTYENLEAFFIRSYIGRPNPIIRLIEIVTAAPQYKLSLYDFRARYYFARSLYSLNENYLLEDWNNTKKLLKNFNKITAFTIFIVLLALAFAIFGK